MILSLFKKKINIEELLGMLLVYGYKFHENELSSLITLVDQNKVFVNEDKDKLKILSEALIVVNLIVGKDIYLSKKISHDEFSKKLGKIYIKFLEDVKRLNKENINLRVNYVAELIKSWGILSDNQTKKISFDPEKRSLYTINSVDDMEKFTLCYAFSDLFSSDSIKNILAFKLAKYFVKNDMMGEFLKEFTIN